MGSEGEGDHKSPLQGVVSLANHSPHSGIGLVCLRLAVRGSRCTPVRPLRERGRWMFAESGDVFLQYIPKRRQ